MKLIGIADKNGANTQVAALQGDSALPLAGIDEFWTNASGFLHNATDISEARPLSEFTQIPLVPPTARIFCIGLNYYAHAQESNSVVPEHPTIFGRWTASLTVGGVQVPVPANEAGLDWEGEVAAYVGTSLKDAEPDEARAAIIGYSTFNDLTARTAQRLTPQWTLGKNSDLSGPMGPLVTADEVGDLRDGLRLQTRVNGITAQDANTKSMIFEVGSVLSLISKTMTINPGDVIATGTPEGVGFARKPAWLLTDGDVVEVEVDKLGTLVTPIGGSR